MFDFLRHGIANRRIHRGSAKHQKLTEGALTTCMDNGVNNVVANALADGVAVAVVSCMDQEAGQPPEGSRARQAETGSHACDERWTNGKA
jgi:hypothetical protein